MYRAVLQPTGGAAVSEHDNSNDNNNNNNNKAIIRRLVEDVMNQGRLDVLEEI